MKKYKLKKRVKNALYIILLLTIIILLVNILYKQQEKAIDKCTSKGYSINYCIDKTN